MPRAEKAPGAPGWRRRAPRAPGSTTAAGLGYAHQQERARLLAEFRDGDLCWRCGRPMRSWQELHCDDVVARALGGRWLAGNKRLAHALCNVRAGSLLGNALRRNTARPRTRRRSRW